MQANGVRILFEQAQTVESRVCTKLTVLYLVSGQIRVMASGVESVLAQGDFVALNVGEPYSLRVLEKGNLCHISFEPFVLDSLLSPDRRFVRCCSSLAIASEREKWELYEEMRKRLESVLYSYLKNDLRLSPELMEKSYGLLDRLTSGFSEELRDGNNQDENNDPRIRDILIYIHENYTETINLSELARRFYLSDSHLSRLFKNAVGLSFRDYLTGVRLEAAEYELCNSDKSVIRIANDCGFSGLASFNKRFKEKYGETPSNYKKNCLEQKNSEKMTSAEDEEMKQFSLASDVSDFISQYEAQQPGEETPLVVECDVRDSRLYLQPWKSCMNFGVASDLLNPTVQKHILYLRDLLDFTYVRFWNLFQDNFILYPNAIGSPLFFSKLDGVIDFLLANRMKPFFQLGAKSKIIVSSYSPLNMDTKVQMSGNDFIENLSDEAWEEILENIFRHLVMKYGGQEMSTWIFEMWSPCPWDGKIKLWYTEEKFAALYRVVRKYVPEALVGGCEFSDSYHSEQIPEIAKQWRLLGIDPDFISWSVLPYELRPNAEGKTDVVWHPEAEYFENTLKNIKKVLEENGLGEKKLFLTVWNITGSSRNATNDSVVKGTYLLDTVFRGMNAGVDLMAYWMGSDVYAEGADTRRMLFGGVGLLAREGIGKPSLHALTFLSRLRSRLIEMGPGYFITANKFGIYSVVYYQHRGVPVSALLKEEDKITLDDLEPTQGGKKKLIFKISHVENGLYNVRRQYVNFSSGYAMGEWARYAVMEFLNKEDMEYIASRSVPNRLFERARIADNMLVLEIDAEDNEFGVIELEYQPGAPSR